MNNCKARVFSVMNDNAKTRKTSDRLKIFLWYLSTTEEVGGGRKDFLYRSQKEQTMKKNTDKLDFTAIKKVYKSKDSIIRVKNKSH